jgi:hypothetical protein
VTVSFGLGLGLGLGMGMGLNSRRLCIIELSLVLKSTRRCAWYSFSI